MTPERIKELRELCARATPGHMNYPAFIVAAGKALPETLSALEASHREVQRLRAEVHDLRAELSRERTATREARRSRPLPLIGEGMEP